MPHWTDPPSDDDAKYPYRIVRTPCDKVLSAVVTSTDLTGCNTHFVANRTVPCEGPDQCQWCQDGHSWRWHGYVTAVQVGSLEHILFECTAAAAETFRTYQLHHGSLRGCHFRSFRPSKRPNGKVVISCSPIDEQRFRLPDPPNVHKMLCHLWSVQYNKEDLAYGERPPFRRPVVLPHDDDGRNR